jgi:hypothetical protein
VTAPVVEEHRGAFDALILLAVQQFLTLWGSLRGEQPGAIREALTPALPALAARYGAAAATLAADWYDDLREAAGHTDRFRAIPAELPDPTRFDALLNWGLQPLFVPPPDVPAEEFVPDLDGAGARLEGGFQRIVANADRDTVMGSLVADPQGRGWARQTTGRSCDFCVMLAGRGDVYSAETADFASHDRCDCVAVPVFGGDPRPVKKFTPSQRRKPGAEANPFTVTAAVARQYAQAARS